jgi:hypothetical protein
VSLGKGQGTRTTSLPSHDQSEGDVEHVCCESVPISLAQVITQNLGNHDQCFDLSSQAGLAVDGGAGKRNHPIMRIHCRQRGVLGLFVT